MHAIQVGMSNGADTRSPAPPPGRSHSPDRSTAVIILERDGSLLHHEPAHPPEPSIALAVLPLALDASREPGTRIQRIVALAFSIFGPRHVDLRVCDDEGGI